MAAMTATINIIITIVRALESGTVSILCSVLHGRTHWSVPSRNDDCLRQRFPRARRFP
jgi:hypothetical protein